MYHNNGQAAAKRIGISYKTLLRWIEKGEIRPEEAKTPTGQPDENAAKSTSR